MTAPRQRPLNPAYVEMSAAVHADFEAGRPIDRRAHVQHAIAQGASRTRAHAWMAELLSELPATAEQRNLQAVQAVEALPAAQPVRLAPAPPASPAPAPPPAPAAVAPPAAPSTETTVTLLPGNTRLMLSQLQSVIDSANKVLAYSYTPEGKVRNPRMVLMGADMLRRSLETAHKLVDKIDGFEVAERFMDEMLGALRAASPEIARDAVERMRAVQGRWSAGKGRS